MYFSLMIKKKEKKQCESYFLPLSWSSAVWTKSSSDSSTEWMKVVLHDNAFLQWDVT